MNTNLKTITVVQTPAAGQILRAHLESAGIDAFLADEATGGMAWHLNQAIGGIKLQVRPEDVEQARTILQEEEQGSPEDPADDLTPTEAEALALRAFRSAFLGLLLEPLALYSLWLVIRVAGTGDTGQPGVRGKVAAALVLDGVTVVMMGALLFLWLS